MVNDLEIMGMDVWKFVDDLTMSEVVQKGLPSHIQEAVDSLSRQSFLHDFQLNEIKCKELRICFCKTSPTLDPVKVNGRPLEVVSSAKILGLNVSDDLKWNVHIAELVKKASSRLFSLKQLKRSAVAPSELVLFYVTCIRSILEYACPVFHRALPSYLSDDLERLQKRAMKVIYPLLSYTAALKESGLSTLHERREVISSKTFAAIKEDKSHKRHELLPKNTSGRYSLRNNRFFNLPKCKTERCKSSFIISHIFSQ